MHVFYGHDWACCEDNEQWCILMAPSLSSHADWHSGSRAMAIRWLRFWLRAQVSCPFAINNGLVTGQKKKIRSLIALFNEKCLITLNLDTKIDKNTINLGSRQWPLPLEYYSSNQSLNLVAYSNSQDSKLCLLFLNFFFHYFGIAHVKYHLLSC